MCIPLMRPCVDIANFLHVSKLDELSSSALSICIRLIRSSSDSGTTKQIKFNQNII